MPSEAEFVVGVDLGTSHTAVAYSPIDARRDPEIFGISQLVGAHEVARRPLLPSTLYLPLDYETSPSSDIAEHWVVGEYARSRGLELTGRLISSAKSWLCHGSVDREAPILPWGSDLPEAAKLSPVRASARVLEVLAQAWNKEHPGAPLERQQLVLTVPASFDQGARQLTVRAAQSVGLAPRLLEEPQAAFYDYLAARGTAVLEELLRSKADGQGIHVLVCDVGGGTTDLSLLRVHLVDGQVAVDRSAVGRHLLLGGDNIDHALAHAVESELELTERLEPALFGQLVQQCRRAKEVLLGPGAPEQHRITLVRPGSALVGAALSSDVRRERVQQIAIEGFFPHAELAQPVTRRSGGLMTFGLPYERDPAITRHVASFVARHLGKDAAVDALLVNGGVFHAPAIRARLAEVVEGFFARPLMVLEHSDPDLAVARGAALFGKTLQGHGLRIGGGSAHGYYLGLGSHGDRRLLCVVPRGAKEAERHVTETPLLLKVGRAVRFELYASDSATPHAPGTLVEPNDDEFEALPQVVAEFTGGPTGDEIGVRVEGELTAVGTLDLECVENPPGTRRFQLAFELRGQEAPAARSKRSESIRATTPLAEADEAVARVFGKGRKDVKEREAKDLVRELERILGARDDWSAEVTRALFDVIAPKHKARRRSLDHERVYFMLVGYCLRPGFGYLLDQQRVALVWPLFSQGLSFGTESRSWQQFFICWRRIAGGLDDAQQSAICDLVEPFIAPDDAKLKRPKGFKPGAPEEMLELLSRLERLPHERRVRFARWLLERTWTSRDPRLWGALGRVAARVTAYASVHHVLPPKYAEEFLDHLLRERWDELKSAPYAATLMARRTDDRARDISDSVRRDVLRRLEKLEVRQDWIACVRDFVPTDDRDRADFLGEELPVGLELGRPEE
ncbi:MAG TPA: Hsp70 family protein [Polyangiaceae bacterium]|nr:Hsp70 family protein [Polyangiaceae bacterium]